MKKTLAVEDLVDVKVSPNKDKISLWEKYPNSSFIFEYKDGTSSRIDHDVTGSYLLEKGAQFLIRNLTDDPRSKQKVKDFDKYLLCEKDLKVLKELENYIVRAWIIPYGKV